jgi:TetR/AcrR family transcriptional regulator
MNEKFFSLPKEKQQAIINAGYRVFSQNSYKKSPVSEIAAAAGISKSLLFHYFRNKKELYLFLWNQCIRITLLALQSSGCYEERDLFNTMALGLKAKVQIMREYPELGNFSVKAYYEKDPDVSREIQESCEKIIPFHVNEKMLNIHAEDFLPGIDLKMMYQDMYWASEGYVWQKMQQGTIDVDQMEEDFYKMIEFWKSIYLRKE